MVLIEVCLNMKTYSLKKRALNNRKNQRNGTEKSKLSLLPYIDNDNSNETCYSSLIQASQL